MPRCPGCYTEYPETDGPIHAYMPSHPACFAAFNRLLVAEYSDLSLQATHRLTVDCWAVQHPGNPEDRRAVQSVGLHLARLMLQLDNRYLPADSNQVMLDFSRYKHSLIPLSPPQHFSITVADIAPFAGTPDHCDKITQWAKATWQDWSEHHGYIRKWVEKHSKA